jgi:hypothetical protein
MDEEKVFVWTEAFNCSELLDPMLKSYLTHHNHKIHVFATEKDFEDVRITSPLIVREILSKSSIKGKIVEKILLSKFKSGHSGTAYLWAHLITSRKEKIFLHVDADTIFVNESLNDLINAICQDNYSLAGSRRPYKFRVYRRNGKDGQMLNLRPDVVNTDCFAFTLEYIKKFPKFWLRRKIKGKRISFRPIVDFFDPISFEIMSKGGKVKYMDSPENGSSSVTNNSSDFMQRRISFAAVGSGINIYKNPKIKTSKGYAKFALASYSLYSKEILGIDLGLESLKDMELVNKIRRLDKNTWRINEI